MFARTERLLLRPGWREDAPALFQAICDERIVRNLAQAPWPYSFEDALAFLNRERGPRDASLLIFLRTTSEPRLVGGIGDHKAQPKKAATKKADAPASAPAAEAAPAPTAEAPAAEAAPAKEAKPKAAKAPKAKAEAPVKSEPTASEQTDTPAPKKKASTRKPAAGKSK